MRTIIISLGFVFSSLALSSQASLDEAKELYKTGKYKEALPIFEAEYTAKPTNASINHWYGVCLFETGGDLAIAEKALEFGASKRVRDSHLYLGRIYTNQYRFLEATKNYDAYEKQLRRADTSEKEQLELYRKDLSRKRRVASVGEDIQIIDSLILNKSDFLKAYKMSNSTGRLEYFNDVFNASNKINSTAYFNEKETKIYYAKADSDTSQYRLYSMEQLMGKYTNEKSLSANNFNLEGDLNYPFLMADGVTIYFSANDENSLGGYDIFISRFNINTDSYLNPERLNAPFNSPYNDYMMVVDEEKGVGWFASDRFQDKGKVCVYTFIPNALVKPINSEDEKYLASRSLIYSIKDSWDKEKDYKNIISSARTKVEPIKLVNYDFNFVIDDNRTYHYFSDFKLKEAENIYKTALSKKNRLEELTMRLAEKRDEYRNSSTVLKSRMSPELLNLEQDVNQLRLEVQNLEVNARNREIIGTQR